MDSNDEVITLKNYLLSILKLCTKIRYAHPHPIDKILMKSGATDQEKGVIKHVLSTPYAQGDSRSWSFNQIIISGTWKHFERTLTSISNIVARKIVDGIDDKKFFETIKEADKNPDSELGINSIKRRKRRNKFWLKVTIAVAVAIATIIVPSAFFNNTNLSMYNDGVSFLNKSVQFLKRLANRASIDRIIINAIFDGFLFFPRKKKY